MANELKFYGFEFSSASHASPELSSAQSCFKGTLTISNIIFLIFGCVLCGVGAYALQSKAGLLAGETLPQGIIVLGVFIILISFLGCLAAFKESRCFLGIYCGFLFLFVVILLGVGIGVYAKKDSASVYMQEGWCAASPSVQADIQTHFLCCGLSYFNDSVPRVEDGVQIYPACQDPKQQPVYVPCPPNLVRGNGQACLPQLESAFEHSYVAAGACAIAFAVLMGVGMVIVCILMSGIKEKKHLEDIRKLHRKLREAKEDPTMAGLAGLPMREGDSGYGEVDLSTGGAGGAPEGHEEGLDTEVQLNVDEVPYAAGTVAQMAPAPAASAAAMSSRGKRIKSPAYDEAEESYSAPADEESASHSAHGTGAGYAQQDEYDDDEYDDRR